MSSNPRHNKGSNGNRSSHGNQPGPQKRKFNNSLDQRLTAHQTETTDAFNTNKKSRNNKGVEDPKPIIKEEVKAIWDDSDDEDGIPKSTDIKNENDSDGDNDDNQPYTIDVKKKLALRKLRTDLQQTHMTQKQFIKAQRQRFEDVFQTPDWAKVNVKEDNKVKNTKWADNDDNDKNSSDDDEIEKIKQRSGDNDSDNDNSDNDNDDDDIKQENKTNKSLLKSYDGSEITNELNDTRIYELDHEGEEYIRSAQDVEQERTLEQLEQLFANSKSLKTKSLTGRFSGTLTSNTLRSGKLIIDRLPDANTAQPSKFLVSSCGFHSNNQLLYAAGMDKALRIYQLDGVNNPCVQSLVFESMPIFKAGFINHESEILLTGRRKFFQTVNIVTSQITKIPEIKGRGEKSWEYWVASNDSTKIAFIGDNATIVIVSSITKQFICEIKCKGGLNDLSWSADDQYIFSTGNDGLIYCFNIAQRSQVFSYRDNGVSRGTAIKMSPNGKWLAAGSANGIVNVYDTNFQDLLHQHDYTKDSFASYYSSYTSYEENIKLPLHEVKSLVHSVEHIKFSPSNEIMAIAARNKQDAVRLIHLPTFTAFTNWPTQQTPFAYVQDIAFSADNTRVAFANDKGRVLLYRLNHYKPHGNLLE